MPIHQSSGPASHLDSFKSQSKIRSLPHGRGSLVTHAVAAASCMVLIALAGCATSNKPGATRSTVDRESGSMPLDAVREREAQRKQLREEQAARAAELGSASADPTAAADPLAEWLARAESDGLLTADADPKASKPKPRSRAPMLPQHAADPVAGFSPPEGAAAASPTDPAPAEALPFIAASIEPSATPAIDTATDVTTSDINAANRPLDLGAASPDVTPTPADPRAQSKPLSALVKLDRKSVV